MCSKMSENTMLGLRFTFELEAPTTDLVEYKDIRKAVGKAISYFFERNVIPTPINFSKIETSLHHLYLYFPKYIIETNIHFEQFILYLKREVEELNLFDERPLYKEDWFEVIMIFDPQPNDGANFTLEMIQEAKNKPVFHNNFQILAILSSSTCHSSETLKDLNVLRRTYFISVHLIRTTMRNQEIPQTSTDGKK